MGQQPIQLRPYQSRGLARIRSALSKGARAPLPVAPTGAGKSVMIAALAAKLAEAERRVLVVAHRREIVLGLRRSVESQYARVGVIVPGERPDPGARIQVASTQSLLIGDTPPADLFVVDEAHHYLSDEWNTLVRRMGDIPLVGFTATPQRADGRPMGDAFDTLIDVVTYRELLDAGQIVPCDVLRPDTHTGLDRAQDPVQAYLQHARGRRAFMFVREVSDAHDHAAALSLAGVRAAVIHATTASAVRDRHVRSLAAGRLDVIVNAYTMTEGVDVPEVDTIVLARNVHHWGAYVQMTGRGLRARPGKKRALLIDLHGVSHLHGLPTQDREHSLFETSVEAREDYPLEHAEYAERGRAATLGLELRFVPSSTEEVVAPVVPLEPPTPTVLEQPSPARYWAALQRDFRAGKLTREEVHEAYEARYGIKGRSKSRQR